MGLQPFACLLVVGEGLEFGLTRTARARAHTNAFDCDWPCNALFLRTTSIHKTTNSLLSHSQGPGEMYLDGKVFQLCEQMGSRRRPQLNNRMRPLVISSYAPPPTPTPRLTGATRVHLVQSRGCQQAVGAVPAWLCGPKPLSKKIEARRANEEG